jgi:hypothetical protein
LSWDRRSRPTLATKTKTSRGWGARSGRNTQNPRQLRVPEAQDTEKPTKIGIFPTKTKKTVENTCFSIDFDHLEAAL